MFRIVIKYFIIFFISFFVLSLFPNITNSVRFILLSFAKSFVSPDRNKPVINIDSFKKDKNILFGNSFKVNINNLENFYGYNINSDGSINNQHKSAGLYADIQNEKTALYLYTRDGSVITDGNITSFDLPSDYDPHNSSGGIRGIFFIKNEPYGLMVTKNFGCQNASIINLKSKIKIFSADCLPFDQSKVHFDAIGGASIHFGENLLISIGTPTNSSQKIRNLAQIDNSFYGKIISINKESIIKYLEHGDEVKTKIFSKGHRNPQGIAKIGNKIFSTEHGPKGGDELNLIFEKGNYGWPVASYGTKYESLYSATYKLNHLKYGFIEPLYEFTPSVAISDLTNCTKQLIDYYERSECLLATSLKEKSLIIFLLSKDLDRVIGVEKINLKQRLRHIAKKKNGDLFSEQDGSIYISTDEGNVLKVFFDLVKNY